MNGHCLGNYTDPLNHPKIYAGYKEENSMCWACVRVTSINNVTENDTHSWHFYINDEPAAVSIAEYLPRERDYLALIFEEDA